MHFKDSEGRKWTFVCNVYTLAKVKRETGADLAKAIEPGCEILSEITDDVALFFGVCCSLLESEMKERGVSEEDFGKAIDDEDIVMEATRALVLSVIGFFPKSKAGAIRTAFEKLWEATSRKAEAEGAEAMRKLDGIDFDKVAEEIVTSPRGNSSAAT